MAGLVEQALSAFRDFETDGVPASGAHEPVKADIRAALAGIIGAIQAAVAGIATYATKADLLASASPVAGRQARVYADSTAANNGIYVYRAGAWTFDTDFYSQLQTVMQPLVDQAQAYATAAGQAKSDTQALLDAAGPLLAMFTAGPDGTGLRVIDKRGSVGAIIDALGMALGGRVSAKDLLASTANIAALLTNEFNVGGNIILSPGADGFRVVDRRGNIGMDWRPSTGVLRTTANPTGSSGGGTSSTGPRVRIASQQGMTPNKPGAQKSNGTTQLAGTDRLPFKVNTKVRNVRFAYLNGWMTNAGPVLSGNSDAGDYSVGLPLKLSVKLEADQFTAVTFPASTGAPISTASFTGYIAGTSLTVVSGTPPVPGQRIIGPGVSLLTFVTGGTGNPAASPLTVSTSQTVGSSGSPVSMTAYGASGYVIGDSAHAISAPIGGMLLPGQVYYTRTFKSLVAGQTFGYMTDNTCWPTVQAIAAGGNPKTSDPVFAASAAFQDGADYTINGSYQGGSYTSSWSAYGPAFIIGEQIDAVPVVLVGGDSISAGAADTNYGRGYITRALETAGVASFNVGIGGYGLANLVKWGTFYSFFAPYVDHIILHIGTNDIIGSSTSLATMQANLLKAFQELTATAKLWPTTVLPRNTSSNAWADYAGQTVTANENVRVQYNNWLRDSTPTGAKAFMLANSVAAEKIGGFIDVCPAAERNADGSALALDSNGQQELGTGGRWLANGTANYAVADGIHPTAAMAALLSQQPTMTAAVALMTI